MSAISLLVSLAATAIFGYSIYFMQYDDNIKGMAKITPAPLHKYGHLKYLTYQCLLIQFFSAILHVLAHFLRFLEKPRDLVFTTLAYPVGSTVVYSFWAVWHLQGREFILPAEASKYYPDWLNHASHTVIVPINFLLLILVNHKYRESAVLLTLLYTGCYTAWLHYIKFESGFYVYKYLESMDNNQRIAYFAATGIFTHILYKSGQFISNIFHGSDGAKSVSPSKKQTSKKQKQK